MHPNYEKEARQRWGSTDAYREHEEKTKNYTGEQWASATEGMDAIFARFAACRQDGAQPDSAAAQSLVASLQTFITQNFYPCTGEILAGLGQMYVSDPRFAQNIDRHGQGTARFVSQAIASYGKGEM